MHGGVAHRVQVIERAALTPLDGDVGSTAVDDHRVRRGPDIELEDRFRRLDPTSVVEDQRCHVWMEAAGPHHLLLGPHDLAGLHPTDSLSPGTRVDRRHDSTGRVPTTSGTGRCSVRQVPAPRSRR